jgi:hypothetical protein
MKPEDRVNNNVKLLFCIVENAASPAQTPTANSV